MNAPLLVRTRSLIAESTSLCAAAGRLCRDARLARGQVGRQVRRSPTRRMARLAKGGSAAPAERREAPRCPICLSESVKLDAMDRLVRAVYQCEACGTLFLHVRKPKGA